MIDFLDFKIQKKFMSKALAQARLAYKSDEVPIGAVVANKNGEVIGRGYNQMEKRGCQIYHAEVQAIKKACKKIGDWRLNDCWIFVTLEPCLMCLGIIKLSRISGLIFGSESPLFGFRKELDKNLNISYQDLIIKEGVKNKQSGDLLKKFFKKARSKADHLE